MWQVKPVTPSNVQREAYLTQCLVWFRLQSHHSAHSVGGIVAALTSSLNIPKKSLICGEMEQLFLSWQTYTLIPTPKTFLIKSHKKKNPPARFLQSIHTATDRKLHFITLTDFFRHALDVLMDARCMFAALDSSSYIHLIPESIFRTLRQMVIAFKPCLFLSCNHCLYTWDFWTDDCKWVQSEDLICKDRCAHAVAIQRNWKLQLGANKGNETPKRATVHLIHKITACKENSANQEGNQGASNKYLAFKQLIVFLAFPVTPHLCSLCIMLFSRSLYRHCWEWKMLIH